MHLVILAVVVVALAVLFFSKIIAPMLKHANSEEYKTKQLANQRISDRTLSRMLKDRRVRSSNSLLGSILLHPNAGTGTMLEALRHANLNDIDVRKRMKFSKPVELLEAIGESDSDFREKMIVGLYPSDELVDYLTGCDRADRQNLAYNPLLTNYGEKRLREDRSIDVRIALIYGDMNRNRPCSVTTVMKFLSDSDLAIREEAYRKVRFRNMWRDAYVHYTGIECDPTFPDSWVRKLVDTFFKESHTGKTV